MPGLSRSKARTIRSLTVTSHSSPQNDHVIVTGSEGSPPSDTTADLFADDEEHDSATAAPKQRNRQARTRRRRCIRLLRGRQAPMLSPYRRLFDMQRHGSSGHGGPRPKVRVERRSSRAASPPPSA